MSEAQSDQPVNVALEASTEVGVGAAFVVTALGAAKAAFNAVRTGHLGEALVWGVAAAGSVAVAGALALNATESYGHNTDHNNFRRRIQD